MYCVKCGVQLADTEKSCPLCGTRVYHPDLVQAEATPLDRLPEETTLQRTMKAFLLSGGKIGEASGELVRPFGNERSFP